MSKFYSIIYLLLFPFSLACQGHQREIKIATYNIYFLDDGISQARKRQLQNVIQELDADIIGFQEIDDPAALENILPREYKIAMLDDVDEVQELALAVRPPFRITSYGYVFPGRSFNEAFPRKRDLLQIFVEGLGREFVILVHHAKSRRGGRLATDPRREKAAVYIMDHIRKVLAGRNVILLGDFNDNPDDRSLNILELGDPAAAGGVDEKEDSFLFNASEQLAAKDYCSYGYSYLYNQVVRETFEPAVKGARQENNKWRNKKHDFRDVKIKAVLFDQILVSMDLKKVVVESGVFNRSIAVRGKPSRIRFVEGKLHYTHRGSLASDHVPVWITILINQ